MTHPPGSPTDPGGGDGTTGPGRNVIAAHPDPMPVPTGPTPPRPQPTPPPERTS